MPTWASGFSAEGSTTTLSTTRFDSGSATLPSIAFSSESSLGWYRSGNSSIVASYGTVQVPFLRINNSTGDNFMLGNYSGVTRMQTGAGGVQFVGADDSYARLNADKIAVNDGSASNPRYIFLSEISLGLYRSASSTLALSYGTIDLTGGGAMTSVASLKIKAGTNNSCGTAVLGSNGSVNVANTYVKTGDLIFLTDQTPGGTLGSLEVLGIRNSSGFTIGSTSITDTSTVAWLIVRPG